MKTLFESQELWDLVENGFPDPDEGRTMAAGKSQEGFEGTVSDSTSP